MGFGTYFSSLSDHSLLRVARKLDSSYAALHDGQPDDDVPDIRFHRSSPFMRATVHFFTTLSLGLRSGFECSIDEKRLNLGWNHPFDDIHFGCRPFPVEFLGPVCKLDITDPGDLSGELKLRFDHTTRSIVNLVGRHIDALVLSTSNSTSRDFAQFSVGLACSCVPLKSLTFQGHSLNGLVKLWRHVGAQLEILNLHSPNSEYWLVTLEQIRKHCLLLKDICLCNPSEDKDVTELDLIEFYSFFGVQLRRANFPVLHTDSCASIVAACPNVRVSCCVMAQEFDAVAVLGRNVEKLYLSVDYAADWNGLQDAMGMCSDLVSLCVDVNDPMEKYLLPQRACSALFSSSLCNLEELHLSTISEPLPLFKAISEATGNLLTLTLEFSSIEDGTVLDGLLMSNPFLEDIWISEERNHPYRTTEADVLEFYSELLDSFKRCRSLLMLTTHTESAKLPPHEEIRDLLVPFRNRGVVLQLHFDGEYVCVGEHGQFKVVCS